MTRQNTIAIVALVLVWATAAWGQRVPNIPNTVTMADVVAGQQALWTRNLADAYSAGGLADPAWDDDARAFLAGVAARLAVHRDVPTQDPPWDELAAAGRELLVAGCDDPIVWTAYGMALDETGLAGEAMPYLREGLACLAGPGGPDLLAGSAAARTARIMRLLGQATVSKRYDEIAHDHFLRAVGSAAYGQDDQRALLAIVTDPWFADLGAVEKRRFAEASGRQRDSAPWTVKMLTARYHVGPFDERGGIVVLRRPSRPHPSFAEARRLLKAAHRDHPDRPEAAAEMLGLLFYDNQGAHAWFERALAAQFDYAPAYARRIAMIERTDKRPVVENLLTFARQCLQTERYDTAVPLVAYQAVVAAGRYEGRPLWSQLATGKRDPIHRMLQRYADAHATGSFAARARLAGLRVAYEQRAWPRAQQWLFDLDDVGPWWATAEEIFADSDTAAPVAVGRIIVETGAHADALASARAAFRNERYDQAATTLRAIARQYHQEGSVMAYLREAMAQVMETENLAGGGWQALTGGSGLAGWRLDWGTARRGPRSAIVMNATTKSVSLTRTRPVGSRFSVHGQVILPDPTVANCEGGLSLETDGGRTTYKLSFSRPEVVRFDRNHENNRNQESRMIMIPLGDRNEFCLHIFDKQVAVYVNGKLVVYEKDLIDPPLDPESQLTLTCGGRGRGVIGQFADLHYRTLDRMPPKGQIGVGDPSTRPAGPMFAGYDDVPAEGELDRTTLVGGDESMPFEDVLRGPGWLAGVRLGLQAPADAPITTIQPVYRTPTGRHLGPAAGRSDRELLEISAPAGYAVGALRIHGDTTLTGVSVVFMRVLADGRLDAGSARMSAVYGWGEVSKTLGGDGRAIVGLAGRMGEGVSALGVVTAEMLNLAGMSVGEPAAPSAREPLPEFILRPGGDVAKLGGSYYRYVDIPLTWAQAKRRCEAMGGRLAVFDSGVVNSYLLYLAGGRRAWIGLSKQAGDDTWRWLDGRVAEGGHWRQGAEAVDAVDAFAYVGWRGTGAWDTARESNLLGFVCQWDDDPRPPDRRKAAGLAIDVSGDDVIYKGHRYRLFNQGVTWARAKAICKSWGGHLITIDSDEENAVAFILSGGQLAFIGASDDEVEGDWRWVDGRRVTHANWAAGEPNNTDEYQHVALIGFGGAAEWDDVAPMGVTVFLCEWDSADEPTELGLDAIVTETAGTITDAIGHSGQWYKAYYEAVTWDQAHQICARLGGRLIQIDSQATNDLATMFTRQGQPMWIDAHRPTDETWETAQGKALGYTNWLTANEGAGIYGPPAATILFEVPFRPQTRGKWTAAPAAGAYGFICQWDHNPGEGAEAPAPAADAAKGSDDEPSGDAQAP